MLTLIPIMAMAISIVGDVTKMSTPSRRWHRYRYMLVSHRCISSVSTSLVQWFNDITVLGHVLCDHDATIYLAVHPTLIISITRIIYSPLQL